MSAETQGQEQEATPEMAAAAEAGAVPADAAAEAPVQQ
jgi:hypothetical protein